jgi:hypothetical protein
MAPLTSDDKTLIRILRLEKGWNTYQMMKEFPLRNWRKSTLNDLIRKIDSTGKCDRVPGSGRPRAVRTPANIQRVADLICSQEDKPGTSMSPREINRQIGISRTTVRRIAKKDLHLKTFRRREVQLLSVVDMAKRLTACKRLKRRMTRHVLNRTWFSDEKVFTVQTPTNSQNDRIYANVGVKKNVPSKRLLKGRKHFSQSVMVSVAVSKLGKTSPFFVVPKAKVNSSYYCEEVLERGLLPEIRKLSGEDFTFQQDGAPAHRSRQTIAFLGQNVPAFIEPENWPPNSPDLNPVDYSIWGSLQQLVYREKIRDVMHLKEVITRCWNELSQNLMDSAIDQWSKRINLVIQERGGHFEQLLD